MIDAGYFTFTNWDVPVVYLKNLLGTISSPILSIQALRICTSMRLWVANNVMNAES